jgi:LysM repeat protein
VAVIEQLNPQATPECLQIGELLFVPNTGPLPTVFEVGDGETFNQIVLSFGLKPEEVAKLNPQLDPHRIKPGDKIILQAQKHTALK